MSGNMPHWKTNEGWNSRSKETSTPVYGSLANLPRRMRKLNTSDDCLDDDTSSLYSDVSAVDRGGSAEICKRLRMLFVEQLYTDVKFILSCGIKPKPTIQAHKAILAIGCPKFKEMFDNKSESTAEIQINNIPFEAFKNVVEFLYTESVFLNNDQIAMETLSAAMKFQVPSLISKCESYIEGTELNEHNVCSKFQLASDNKLTSLKDKCAEFIKENTSTVLRSLDFRSANVSTIRAICKMDRLNLRSEMELLDGIFRWVEAQPEAKLNKRAVIEPLLRHIRFLTLTCDEFNRFVQIQPLVFTAPEAANILVSLASKGRPVSNLPAWCNKGSNRCVYHVPATLRGSIQNLNQDQYVSIPLKQSSANQFLSNLTCVIELRCQRGRHRINGLKLSFDDPVFSSSRIDHLFIRVEVEPSKYTFDEFAKIENSKDVAMKFSKPLLAKGGDKVFIRAEAKGVRDYKFLQFDDTRSFLENSPFECSLVSEPKTHKFFFISQVVYTQAHNTDVPRKRHHHRPPFRK